MSLTERLFSTSESGSDEQLASQGVEGSELEPRGEQRDASGGGFFSTFWNRDDEAYTRKTAVGTDVSVAPEKLEERYNQYVQTVPLVWSPLTIFGDAVTEPGWTVSAEIDDEPDDDMQEALDLWGSNCAIHAQEPGHDIIKLAEQVPEKRRGKGIVFFEKVRYDDGSLAGLMPLKPSTMSTFARDDQPILVQPDDDVPADHPRTEDDEAAAFVQYYAERPAYQEEDQIAFTADDIVKITFNAPEGEAWGTPLWVIIREHIDGLYQKLRDRNASIRINGHPWRVLKNDTWSAQEASSFLNEHFGNDLTTWLAEAISSNTRSDDDVKDREDTFAGRVDAVPHDLEIDEYTGDVPDITDAVMDDIENIFSAMPVSKFKIAYEEDINQFVVDPQEAKDERNVVKERQLIREAIEPVFQEKADELASGDEYEGEVTWKLEQPDDENPLERESYDAEQFKATVDAMEPYGASREFAYWVLGVDPEEFEQIPAGAEGEEEWEPEPLGAGEGDGEGDETDEE